MPHQRWLTTRTERWVAAICGNGAGKTAGGIFAFALLCLNEPGGEGLIVAPTEALLTNPIRLMWEKTMGDLIVDYNKNEKWYKLVNGCLVGYASADHPKTLVGRNVRCAWVDEAQDVKPEAWREIKSRVRAPSRKTQGIVTATPMAGSWLQREFDSGMNNRAMIRASSFDNPFNDKDWAHSQLESLSEADARAFIYGEWVSQTGLVFQEWRRDLHLIDYEPRRDLPVYVGVDFGYRWQAAVFAQQLPDGRIVIFDEDLPEYVSTEALGWRLAAKLKGYKVGAFYVDPAGAEFGTMAQLSGLLEVDALERGLTAAGINKPVIDYVDPKDRGARSVNTGLEQMRGLLMSATGKTRLYVARSMCNPHQNSERGVVRGFDTWSWRKDCAKPVKGEQAGHVQHSMDAARYLIRHRLESESRKPMRSWSYA